MRLYTNKCQAIPLCIYRTNVESSSMPGVCLTDCKIERCMCVNMNTQVNWEIDVCFNDSHKVHAKGGGIVGVIDIVMEWERVRMGMQKVWIILRCVCLIRIATKCSPSIAYLYHGIRTQSHCDIIYLSSTILIHCVWGFKWNSKSNATQRNENSK